MVRNRTGADSKQDYGTPLALIDAVQQKFGVIAFDLAASAENAIHPRFFSEADDALSKEWNVARPDEDALLWLNPPFKHIEPWAKKCARQAAEHGVRIAMLTPASVGAQWFVDHVWQPFDQPWHTSEFRRRSPSRPRAADVYFLTGRLTFVGATDPYPKDCMLVGVLADAEWNR